MTKIWRKKEWEEAEKISPSYYKKGIEVTDFILSNDLGWCEGNIVKYILRQRESHTRFNESKVVLGKTN